MKEIRGAVQCGLLRRPNSRGRVGNAELSQSFDLFTGGQRVGIGEVSRAWQYLTGHSVAPGTEDTFPELHNERPQRVAP